MTSLRKILLNGLVFIIIWMVFCFPIHQTYITPEPYWWMVWGYIAGITSKWAATKLAPMP